ncbi:MAG: ATP-dependent Clp protease proteolytic subunit [Eubacteriales bacterium]
MKKEELEKKEIEEKERKAIEDVGQVLLTHNKEEHKIHLISVIGEVEGHENLGSSSKSTQYEHIIPQLAAIEDNPEVDGILVVLNTMGGDVEAGLAIAESIAGVTKPTVSIILGGAHSIGIPIAVSANRTFIAKSASMTIHPVRRNGMIIGVHQSFEHFKKIQDRIIDFVVEHSEVSDEHFRSLMLNTGELVSDIGTIVSGEEAVSIGICDEVGTLSEALKCLHEMIDDRGIIKKSRTNNE